MCLLNAHSLPFESIGVRVFFIQLMCHIFSTFTHFTILSATGSFHMGTAMYVSTMSTDIGWIFNNLSPVTVDRSTRNERAIKLMLRQIIEFHGELIEIKESLKDIMSSILFVKIVNMGIFFAACLLQMEVVCDALCFNC